MTDRLPCGHLVPLHQLVWNGRQIGGFPIVNPPTRDLTVYVNIPATVWCDCCGWVTIDDEQYQTYRDEIERAKVEA